MIERSANEYAIGNKFISYYGSTFRWRDGPKEIDPEHDFKAFRIHATAKPIVQLSLDNSSFIKIYSSYAEAEKAMRPDIKRKIYKATLGDKAGVTEVCEFFWRTATDKEILEHFSDAPPYSERFGDWAKLMVEHLTILVSSKGYYISNNGIAGLGTRHANGYYSISVAYRQCRMNRVVFQAFNPSYELQPEDIVDHIDEDKSNNCIENLRLAPINKNSEFAIGIPVRQYSLSGRPEERSHLLLPQEDF